MVHCDLEVPVIFLPKEVLLRVKAVLKRVYHVKDGDMEKKVIKLGDCQVNLGSYGYVNTLIMHIRRLREKIEEDPSHPKHLLTARGLGYKLI